MDTEPMRKPLAAGRPPAATRHAVEALLGLGAMAARTHSLLARQQLAALAACLGAATGQLEAVAAAAGARDLLTRQAVLAGVLGEKLVGTVRQVLDIQAQVRDELSAWLADAFGTRTLAPGDP